MVCSYCGDFELMQVPGYDERLREHLASNHVDVSLIDTLRASDLLELFIKLKPSVFPDKTWAFIDADSDVDSDADTNVDTDTDAYTDTDFNSYATDTDIDG
ncbi:hypothetical protein V8E53_010633 [Lactarius tabidus]